MEEKVEQKTIEKKTSDEIVLKGKGFNLIPERFYKKVKAREKAIDLNIYSITVVILFIGLTLGLVSWRYYLKLQMVPLAEQVADKMNEVASLAPVESKARGIETRMNMLETIELSSYDIFSFTNAVDDSTDVQYQLKAIEITTDFKVTVEVNSVNDATSLMADLEKNSRFKEVNFVSLESGGQEKGNVYFLTFSAKMT